MADWYASSAAWTAIAQFATGSYTVGQIVRPLTAPAFNAQYAFRCTTAGSASAEPTWTSAPSNNGTVTATGGAVFTNVTGQAAYGWSAAAGNLYSLSSNSAGGSRVLVGDRAFLSSDHSETNATPNYPFNNAVTAYGVIEIISVNRAGAVPPGAADALSGAAIIGNGNVTLEPYTSTYWQGIAFTMGSAGGTITLANGGWRQHYFKNCAFIFTTSNTTAYFTNNNEVKVTFDNTTVSFNNAGQSMHFGISYGCDFRWINTPAAIPGTVPTNLFYAASTNSVTNITCQGVDLSAVTTTLYYAGTSGFYKVLLDSCRINASVARLGTSGYNNTTDEVELVNCYDGTNIISERHTPAGDITTERSVTLVGGAQDDVGLFSHKLVSSTRCDAWVMTLDSFWMDVENAYTGSLRTATVEIVSSANLNNNDITLLLEYQGTSGSSLASFASSLASPLTATAALPASTATWNNAPFVGTTWNPADMTNVALSGGNLIATIGTSAGGVRAIASFTAGKYYWEATYTSISTNGIAGGIALVSGSLSAPAVGTAFPARSSGNILVNNVFSGSSLGIIGNGNVVGIAVDFTAQLIWFRIAPSGNWNGSGTANPATGAGGVSISTISSGALYPFATGGGGGTDVLAANFGGAAFSGVVPSGFTAGFPAAAGTGKQHMQVTFTPQVAGRVRGYVRLGKASTTVWVNPQIIIT